MYRIKELIPIDFIAEILINLFWLSALWILLIFFKYSFFFNKSILFITIKSSLSNDRMYFIISKVVSKLLLFTAIINKTKLLSNIALEACLKVLLDNLAFEPKIPGVSRKINCLPLKEKIPLFCFIVVWDFLETIESFCGNLQEELRNERVDAVVTRDNQKFGTKQNAWRS